jgi:phosphatidate phosphatase APP1
LLPWNRACTSSPSGACCILTAATSPDACCAAHRPVSPSGQPAWWRNLRDSWRRFDSDPVGGVEVEVEFRGQKARALSDAEGYYTLRLPVGESRSPQLWEMASATLGGKGKVFLQPVQCVPQQAAFGIISDIDDTILESKVTKWRTAVQLALLHNARTRKPLEGVAGLYQALQRGLGGHGPNPVFYVSASPWNLYDLLEDFLDLNDIPQGPLLLRDVDLDRISWSGASQARAKVEGMKLLIGRYPSLRWLLVGDSGQVDAQLYAELALEHPGRVLAVYIRDIDPEAESGYDHFVDTHIARLAGSGVAMLRVGDSNAIAAHARSLGLIDAGELPGVAREVRKDQARPEQKQAVHEGAREALAVAPQPAGG